MLARMRPRTLNVFHSKVKEAALLPSALSEGVEVEDFDLVVDPCDAYNDIDPVYDPEHASADDDSCADDADFDAADLLDEVDEEEAERDILPTVRRFEVTSDDSDEL